MHQTHALFHRFNKTAKMAAKLSDDELRTRLVTFFGDAHPIPPIVDATRPLLLAKLSKLENGGELEIVAKKPALKEEKKIFHPLKKDPISFKSLVFFDVEATGLASDTRPPRITELCFKSLDVEHFQVLQSLLETYKGSEGFEEVFPRVVNSLNICLNPGTLIPDKVVDITGLNNYLLDTQPRFRSSTVDLLKSFLSNLTQPICLIAHNGFRYDFPLLKAEIDNVQGELGHDIFVVDSLTALKEIFKEPIQDDIENILAYESFEDDMMEIDSLQEAQKPCLRDEDELNLFKTPEKSPVNESLLTPPPTGHSSTRRQNSELLSSDRRKNVAKVKKKLSFEPFKSSKPSSFSLPLLHQHLFGAKPKVSHGAEVDVKALVRVCAARGEEFLNYAQNNYQLFENTKKMW